MIILHDSKLIMRRKQQCDPSDPFRDADKSFLPSSLFPVSFPPGGWCLHTSAHMADLLNLLTGLLRRKTHEEAYLILTKFKRGRTVSIGRIWSNWLINENWSYEELNARRGCSFNDALYVPSGQPGIVSSLSTYLIFLKIDFNRCQRITMLDD